MFAHQMVWIFGFALCCGSTEAFQERSQAQTSLTINHFPIFAVVHPISQVDYTHCFSLQINASHSGIPPSKTCGRLKASSIKTWAYLIALFNQCLGEALFSLQGGANFQLGRDGTHNSQEEAMRKAALLGSSTLQWLCIVVVRVSCLYF